jgi:hypothetical protein
MACVNHPDVPEVTRCDQCGRRVCADCFVQLEGRPLCGQCKDRVVRRVERGFALEVGARGPSPWERERSVASLLETLKAALLSPTAFFSGLAPEGKGYWSYLIVLGWPSAVLGALLAFFFPVLAGLGGFGAPGNPFGSGENALFLAFVVVVAPLQLLIGTCIQGGILHLFLRLVGGANARIETTIRTVVYAQSVICFNWVPLLGPLVAAVWSLVLLVIGLKHMHTTTYGRVLAAVLLPITVCVGFVMVAIIVPLVLRQAR